MPIDDKWIMENELWFAGQQNLVTALKNSNEYTLKEIELHKEAVDINIKMIEHYEKGIADQKKVVEDYIKENE